MKSGSVKVSLHFILYCIRSFILYHLPFCFIYCKCLLLLHTAFVLKLIYIFILLSTDPCNVKHWPLKEFFLLFILLCFLSFFRSLVSFFFFNFFFFFWSRLLYLNGHVKQEEIIWLNWSVVNECQCKMKKWLLNQFISCHSFTFCFLSFHWLFKLIKLASI